VVYSLLYLDHPMALGVIAEVYGVMVVVVEATVPVLVVVVVPGWLLALVGPLGGEVFGDL